MVQNNDLINEYFEWMYHLVCNDQYYSKVSYRKLLYFLHSTDYIPTLPMDENRRIDGIDFRYRFCYENDYSYERIKDALERKNCSVLEMMIALAFKVEEEITSDVLYGNRTGQWFWSMIVNLGLNTMNDKNFDQDFCEKIIDRFMRNKYTKNGTGGLFTIAKPKEDLRDVDIWCQFMWYLNETIYDTDDIFS